MAAVFNVATTYKITASAFDSSGFTLTADTANSDKVFYLALELPNQDDAHVLFLDSATSTGNSSTTGAGFQPDFLMLLQTMCTAANTNTTTGYIGVGLADGTAEASVNACDLFNAGVTDTQSTRDASNILNLDFDDGTDDALASLNSFDSDGFTLNYSDASGTARKMLAICIGDSAAGGTHPVNPFGHALRGAFGGPI